MGVSYLLVSAVVTAASVAGLQWWVVALMDEIRKDGLIEGDVINAENILRALQLAIGSRVTVALLVNLAVNLYVLMLLCLKRLFFGQLNSHETRKLVERLINYVISRVMTETMSTSLSNGHEVPLLEALHFKRP